MARAALRVGPSDADPDDALALLQGLYVEGRSAVGRSAGGRVRREQVFEGPLPPQ